MTTITLITQINAPINKVFDVSRNIDFHLESASQTREIAIAGVTSGEIGFGESVTWRGKHFGMFLTHTSKIVDFKRPEQFTDVMTQGHFTYFAHQHHFTATQYGTEMTDVLTYKTPFGIIGKAFDVLALKKHLTRFLKHRNQMLKLRLENTEDKLFT